MTVSWRLSASAGTGASATGGGGAAGGSIFVTGQAPVTAESESPHSVQNLAFGRFSVAQEGQRIRSGAPHSPQNFAPAGLSLPQASHFMSRSLLGCRAGTGP